MKIKILFEEALLAQAAYASLSVGMEGVTLIDALKALEPDGLTQAQAEYFASKYKVVQQVNESGFSATLFQNIESGEYHLANRGTDGVLDGDWTDANASNSAYGMAYNHVAELINFYLRLSSSGADVPQYGFEEVIVDTGDKAPESSVLVGHVESDSDYEIIEDIYLVFKETSRTTGTGVIADTKINVTGHSLGGHLAATFALLFPSMTKQATTFDSAGIVGDHFDIIASLIGDVVGLTPNKMAELNTHINNFKAPLDPISQPTLWSTTHPGGKLTNIFIEAEDVLGDLPSHDMDRLVDSLAVMNLLYLLDNSITLEKANELLPKASSDEYTELEGMMNHLARLFGKETVAITESDHDQVYRVIKQITDTTEENSYSITAVSENTVNHALAGEKASLYALVHLQPFVVSGTSNTITNTLYKKHDNNDALDVENYSKQYLTDRAAMLHWLIEYNQENKDYDKTYSDSSFTGNVTFIDMKSDVNNGQDLELNINGKGGSATYERVIFGTDGDDSNIKGDAKNDRLYGGDGKDILYGKEGDDHLEGGLDNDKLYGGDGGDFLLGGKGDDHLESGEEDVYGEGAINILHGGDGRDTLVGGDGIDYLYGGDGNDSLWVGKGALHVVSWNEAEAKDADIVIKGSSMGFTLGTELMVGGDGFDSYYLGASANHVIIHDSDGQGAIHGGAEDIGDKTYVFTGGKYLRKYKDVETGLQVDVYLENDYSGSGLGGREYHIVYELDGSQTLITYGVTIPNFSNGMLGIDLEGGRVGEGINVIDDILKKFNFDEAFEAADVEMIKMALRTIYSQSAIARQMLSDYAYQISIKPELINTDFDTSSTESALLTSAGQDPEFPGTIGANTPSMSFDLQSLNKNTYISTEGKAVKDTIQSALVFELVSFIYKLGDTNTPGETSDAISFANTILNEMGLAERSSDLAYDETGNTHIANFEYTQGQSIDRAFTLLSEKTDENNIDTSGGGNLKDLIIGNETANTIRSGSGDDFLHGGAGNDRLYGGEGNDYLVGGEGADYLSGGYGIDTVDYSTSIEGVDVELSSGKAWYGDATGDTLVAIENIVGSSWSDYLTGDVGDNELTGGKGRDYLYGGAGNDTYVFNFGDGVDVITDSLGSDKIVFGEGITSENLRISHDVTESHWLIELYDDFGDLTGDKITINNAFKDLDKQIESIEFYDGTSLNLENITSRAQTSAVQYSNDYFFNWGMGTVRIYEDQNGGFDTVYFGIDVGTDSLELSKDGNDLILSLSNYSKLIITNYYRFRTDDEYIPKHEAIFGPKEFIDDTWTIERFVFGLGGTGYEWGALHAEVPYIEPIKGSEESDTITGTDSDDVIDAGGGDDILQGGIGSDIYRYKLGDGNDIIIDSDGENYLKLGKGITTENISIEASDDVWSGNMDIYTSTGDKLSIQGNNSDILSVSTIRFFDGTVWEAADFFSHMVVVGTDGDDSLDYSPLEFGTTFDAGLGNDTIFGGSGDDTYLFNFGDGQDVILENNGEDKIVFGVGITADNLRITHDETESHWIIELLDDGGNLTGDSITVENAFIPLVTRALSSEERVDRSYIIESFEFFDGSVMTYPEIQLAAQKLYTDLEPEIVTSIEGTSESDTLVGDENTNIINGYDGNDVINGGLKDDTLNGGNGDDVYLYELGDGNDVINELEGNDTLRFGVGITPENISITASDTDMFITLPDGQVVTIIDWRKTTYYTSGGIYRVITESRIEQLEFSDGTVWQDEDIFSNMVIVGVEGDSYIYNGSTVFGTHYDMGLGDDDVYGGKGNDVYNYSLGDGNDTISDFYGLDIIRFDQTITPADITVTVSGRGRNLSVALPDNAIITIMGWNNRDLLLEKQFEFADGTVWHAEDIIANMVTEEADSLSAELGFNLLVQSISSFGDGTDEYERQPSSYNTILPIVESAF
ncbi:calcium-binding protein [Colwellia sp. RSH04]|uniref:calcium-binding protein n=1 Tax=Colwellia sp. RSH04 TaxID=2305464 RepID=UPI000E58C33E|nr:calcium-binding protein [Colwellia sp. RSH04]RHW77517.1 hypothetical protein D1094_00755 [Colwellia sp. RSH04]